MEYCGGLIWIAIDPVGGLSYINGSIVVLGKLKELN